MLKKKLSDVAKNREQLGGQYDEALQRGIHMLNKEALPISSCKKK